MGTLRNVIEWQFSDRRSTDAAKSRLSHLETQIFGTEYAKDSFSSRLNRLTKAAFPNGSLTSSTVVLPKDSLLKVKFMEDISSKTNQQGDTIDFVVDDNVYVGDVLVLPKGAKGYGQIKKIVQPRIFGRDARIDLDFSHVVAVNGGAVPVMVGDLAKQQAKTAAGAAGASIGGMILFGPVGVVGGAFVKGSSVTIPAGTNTYVQVAEDTSVDGVILAGSSAIGQQLDGSSAQGGPSATQPASAVTKEPAAEPVAETAPAQEAPKENPSTVRPPKSTGVALDETGEQPAEEKAPVQEPTAKDNGDEKADAETEAALAEDQKRDEEAKKLVRRNNSQPMLDEDDGSAYNASTL